jgi:predicted nucleic acid-binding protein
MGDVWVRAEYPAIVVADANVLIDYAISSRDVLTRVSRHLWAVHVPRPVFNEVDQLDYEDAAVLGITVVDPTFAQLEEAAKRGGRLSAQDRLCFIIARDNKWRCWTNDSRLRKLCLKHSIPAHWGLEVMLILCKMGQLDAREALKVAGRIHDVNKHHVSSAIIQEFTSKLHRSVR